MPPILPRLDHFCEFQWLPRLPHLTSPVTSSFSYWGVCLCLHLLNKLLALDPCLAVSFWGKPTEDSAALPALFYSFFNISIHLLFPGFIMRWREQLSTLLGNSFSAPSEHTIFFLHYVKKNHFIPLLTLQGVDIYLQLNLATCRKKGPGVSGVPELKSNSWSVLSDFQGVFQL